MCAAMLYWLVNETVYLEKMDTCSRIPGLATCLVRSLPAGQIRLTARAQDQYLFHLSKGYPGKQQRSGAKLVQFYRNALDVFEQKTILVPGENVKAPGWAIGLGYSNETLVKDMIQFEDDVKTRAIETLLTPDATVKDLIEVLPVLPECSLDQCGFFSCVISGSTGEEPAIEEQEFVEFMKLWMDQSFENESKNEASTLVLNKRAETLGCKMEPFVVKRTEVEKVAEKRKVNEIQFLVKKSKKQ
ncbi:hypothetical protein EDD86DRAFT_198599 [Gorgonomyces haynaldii]|nr:hypothetical protein EDD86DRAFT_198599 [Gorgonomyces haynaldii]